ncbi:Spo0B domain-containing protein [Planococcus sp. CAU13]|uniref:Spo0B domain-containing protein n=1 Tax=Planococcus sp. CAU13 TaxID=1541197 RepID=UPI0005300675|nr:Spo0B domain-containing protein [Planococcus sp. CAU13]
MDNPFTVAQALRHARHDFLNELQLIGMKLDLGHEQEVKSIIRSHAEAAVQLSRLAALKMPLTEDWLLTAEWRFPDFRFHLGCAAKRGASAKDAAIAEWLERFFTEAADAQKETGAASPYSCRILMEENGSDFILKLELDSKEPDTELPAIPGLLARKRVAADNTNIIVSAQMEG